MQEVFFKSATLKTSSHPDYDGTETYVGKAIATDNGEDLDIEITELYICIDPNIGDSPLAYCKIDEENTEFKKTEAYASILFNICEQYGKVNSGSDEAKAICKYYKQRAEIAKAYDMEVTVHEKI